MRHETGARATPWRANGGSARASGTRRPVTKRQARSSRLAWRIFLLIPAAPGFRGSGEPTRVQPLGRPSGPVGGHESVDTDDRFSARHPHEAQRYWPEAEADEAPTERRGVVVLALGDGRREHPDLAAVEPDALVEPPHLLVLGLGVREEDLGRTRLENDVPPGGSDHVGEALADEDHGGVLLPKRAEPLLDLLAEHGVQRGDPCLLDDEEAGALLPQPALHLVEKVKKNRDQVPFAEVHEMADLEDLERAGTETVIVRIE